MKSWFKILLIAFIGIVAASSVSYSQPKSQAKGKKKDTKGSQAEPSVSKANASANKTSGDTTSSGYTLASFVPTMTFDSGTVGSMFYPVTVGSSWKLRTVSSLYGPDNKMVVSDTAILMETVKENNRVSIQGLPLIACESKAFRPGHENEAKLEESEYYVDDSVILAVFNHSLYHGETRAMLTAPLKIGTAWKERTEDTIYTVIASMGDTVIVPYGKFMNSVATVTTLGQGMFAKFFVPNVGIVKTVFRGPGPGGQGVLLVTTELLDIVRGAGALPKIEIPAATPAAQKASQKQEAPKK